MNRHLRVLFLIFALLLMISVSAFAAGIPHDTRILTPDEVRAILLEGTNFDQSQITDIYNALISKDPDSVPALKFSIDDSDPTAFNKSLEEYGEHIVHFTIRASEDISIIPIGHYETIHGTIALPPIKIPANTDFKIMDYFMSNWDEEAQEMGNWPGTYSLIAKYVKEFDCLAVPVTDDLKELLKDAPGFEDIQKLPSMQPDTALRISMSLYPLESEDPWKLGSPVPVVTKDFFAPWPEPVPNVDDLPQTGDSSMLTLWLALGAMSLLCVFRMRRARVNN